MADLSQVKPPRLTGNAAEDFNIIRDWMQSVFDALVAINKDVTTLAARVTALEP